MGEHPTPDRADEPLSGTAKELLSWMIVANVLLRTDEDLRVIETHPGGGLYDCLTIIDEHGTMPVTMNRAGQGVEIAGRSISNFWTKSAKQGPHRIAERIVKLCGFRQPANHVPSLTALSVLNVANWLNHYRTDTRSAVNAFYDSSGAYCGPNSEIVAAFDIPTPWLEQEPPSSMSDPLAWLFALVSDGSPKVLVNTRTGAAIATTGAQWKGWPELSYQPDGNLGCPVASQVTAFDDRHGGELVAKVICAPADASRMRGRYQEECFNPVNVEPVFEVPMGYFESINPASSRN